MLTFYVKFAQGNPNPMVQFFAEGTGQLNSLTCLNFVYIVMCVVFTVCVCLISASRGQLTRRPYGNFRCLLVWFLFFTVFILFVLFKISAIQNVLFKISAIQNVLWCKR